MRTAALDDYVRRLRLERAAVTLRTTDRPIVEIALDAGYSAHEAFSRAFRTAFTLSPSEYRRVGIGGSEQLSDGEFEPRPARQPPLDVRYDACVTIDRDARPVGEFGVQTIAGGPYAMTTHIGPYDPFEATYLRLIGEWTPRSGHVIRPLPCLEFYLNSPENTEPEDLITDILLPLEP